MKAFWFFDLDGTLADTEMDIRLAWKAALQDLGLSCPHFDAQFVAGPSLDEMVKRLFPDLFTPELAQAIRDGFGCHYDADGFPNTVEYPGMLERVRALKAAGAHVFIATNKRLLGAQAMGRKFGWDTVFEGLYTGDMYGANPAIGKLRKPQLLARMLQELGVSAADCVMVGDTGNDFEAARANGIASIGVAWGYGTEAELAQADRVVMTPQEIGWGASMERGGL